jgi:hypothetical protein
MGIGSLGTLARERRHVPQPGQLVPGQPRVTASGIPASGTPARDLLTQDAPSPPKPRPSAPAPAHGAPPQPQPPLRAAEAPRDAPAPYRPAASRPGTPGGTGLSRFEQAIPTEIIAFYTGVITACEAVLSDRPDRTFAEFRLVVFLVALALTVVLAGRATRTAVDGWMAVGRAPEWWTATLSFVAWGLALPGSFLYVWLDRDVLTVTIATVTAGTALILGLGTSPRLRQDEPAS